MINANVGMVRKALGLAVVATVAVPAAAAFAASQKAPDPKPAVVGPTLDILRFGDVVGIPLGCQAATSAIGSGASYLGQSAAAGPVIQAVNDGCNNVSAQGAAGLEQARQATLPLAAINPYANPVIEQAATSVEQFGTDYADEIAPLGPTVAGTGPTIRYFEGK
jgi:hypothetical protein